MVVVLCGDPAIREAMGNFKRQFERQYGSPEMFEVKKVGGAFALTGRGDERRESTIIDIIDMLEVSQAEEVLLVIHGNCRAQGGTVAFGNPDHERTVSSNRLLEAYGILRPRLSADVTIRLMFLPLSGAVTIVQSPDDIRKVIGQEDSGMADLSTAFPTFV